LVVVRRSVPLRAGVNVGLGIVRQAMAANLFAGIVEDLYELAREVGIVVVGVVSDFVDLAVGPVRRGDGLRNQRAGRIFQIILLQQFAIGAERAGLGP